MQAPHTSFLRHHGLQGRPSPRRDGGQGAEQQKPPAAIPTAVAPHQERLALQGVLLSGQSAGLVWSAEKARECNVEGAACVANTQHASNFQDGRP